MKIKVGLFGAVGHQIQNNLKDHPLAEIVALAGFSPEQIPEHLKAANVRVYPDLDTLLDDPEVQLVSFCSPRKDEQGHHVIRCLEAGKHAYAEKPCCMDEATLDQIIATARRTGRIFHEMTGVSLAQPYSTLHEIVMSGVIGEVIQVLSQKSYPWADWRPADERVDGGLAMQVGIYNTRFVEHVAGVKIKSIQMRETRLGNTIPGSQCRRAVSFLMELENGGLASAVSNYCCPAQPGWKKWGYESLIIFGSNGFVESLDSGRIGTLSVNGQEPTALDFSRPCRDYLDMFLGEIQTGKKVIPFSLEEEVSPTRWVIRAKTQLAANAAIGAE